MRTTPEFVAAIAEVERTGAVVDDTIAALAAVSIWHPFRLRRAMYADAEAWTHYNTALAEARRIAGASDGAEENSRSHR